MERRDELAIDWKERQMQRYLIEHRHSAETCPAAVVTCEIVAANAHD